MSQISRIKLAIKAFGQLGPNQVGLYTLYQLGLRTGHFRRTLDTKLNHLSNLEGMLNIKFQPCLPDLPDRNDLLARLGSQIDQLYNEANEIVNGYIRLFGGQTIPLELSLPDPLESWTKYESGANLIQDQDIKFIWEPGRFGWACKLAMAFYLSRDERYSEAFWLFTDKFFTSNPPYLGPHWSSAQEVAIRMVALTFAIHIFIQSSHTTSERFDNTGKWIAIHAERIPTTLIYARSQNNNHLITEALGLYTASAVLRSHPLAPRWHKLGWKWLLHAFHSQISADGTYTQHSTNYHRLILQAALWAHAVHEQSFRDEPISQDIMSHLQAATHWLWKLVDPDTGGVPNLGHNDGAYILPLTVCLYKDYRPVIHAAARAFLQTNLYPRGPWDDMSAWLCQSPGQSRREVDFHNWHQPSQGKQLKSQSPFLLFNHKNDSWAAIQIGRYTSRPAHADQLHMDLWWRGYNLAQDPGTYLYNSPPPWDNSLTSAFVHNTVVVDDQEFMQRAGRFLYLDWAQAKILDFQTSFDGASESLIAEHYGYQKIGVVHKRKVMVTDVGHWEVIDRLDGHPNRTCSARLHWLLPDWEYDIQEPHAENADSSYKICIKSPHGWVSLKLGTSSKQKTIPPENILNFQLARAGQTLIGSGSVLPITGWTSPTYGVKIPALACILNVSQTLPIEIISEWILPGES